MKKYVQLNYEERVSIKIGLWENMNVRKIALILNRSQSTISKEIKREITIN